MNQPKITNLNQFVEKIDQMKKQDQMDLSSDQDLTIAIMNLISIEEHFFFTGAKTEKPEYYNLIDEVREIRKALLQQIITDYEGEVWCISKHLLAASYRLMEVGTKQLSMGKKNEAYDLFQKAYDLYSLFWGLNMNLISTKQIKKIDPEAINKHEQFLQEQALNIKTQATTNNQLSQLLINSSERDNLDQSNEANPVIKKSFMGKFGDLVRRAIDCCIE